MSELDITARMAQALRETLEDLNTLACYPTHANRQEVALQGWNRLNDALPAYDAQRTLQPLDAVHTKGAVKAAGETDRAAADRILGLADQCIEEWRADAEDGGDPNDEELIEREAEWRYWRPRLIACVEACAGIPTEDLVAGLHLPLPVIEGDQISGQHLMELAESAGFDIAEDVQPHITVWGWGDEHGNGSTGFDSEREAVLHALDSRYGDAWRFEVANGDTRRSFIEFCEQAIEDARNDQGMKP